MCVQASYDNGPHQLMWACSWAAPGKITISGNPKCLKYCVIFVTYTQFYKYGCGQHNKTWQAADWKTML